MKQNIKPNRESILSLCGKTHKWIVPLVSAPLFLIIVTGILLQMKNILPGIQPLQIKGSGKSPKIAFQEILSVARSVSAAKVNTWEDIRTIDVRPSLGVVRVRCKSEYEIQIDAQSGQILNYGLRRTNFLISLHEGSWFSEHVKYWIYLPAAFLLLILWITGTALFFVPLFNKIRRKRFQAIPKEGIKFQRRPYENAVQFRA